MSRRKPLAVALALLLLPMHGVNAWALQAPATAVPPPPPPPPDTTVRATIIPGTPQAPQPPLSQVSRDRRGRITLNFPGVEVQAAARAILGDLLRLNFSVDPTARGSVTVVTSQPVARDQVLRLFEDSLRAADMGLVVRGGVYTVVPVSAARAQAEILGGADFGYGNETIQLQFVNAAEIKRLLDPIVPGAISQVDEARNILVVSGTTGQRNSVRQLVQQFDVDWLRGMSFALFVPQRTDSRLIVPELDKLINAPGAPTAGLVRLISMERLNGILAISAQPQYLEDIRRWVEILDREGESAERKLYVYRVQNGRSSDLAAVLIRAFGGSASGPGTTGPAGTAQAGGPTFATSEGTVGAATAGLLRPPAILTPNGAAPQTGIGQTPLPGAAAGVSDQSQQSAATTGQIGPAGPIITSDDANNAVVVFGTPRDYAVVEDALRKLDVLPLQVLIEAAITEVTLNDNLKYGAQWLFRVGDGRFSLGNDDTLRPKPVLPGFNWSVANADIRATLDALSGLTTINVISAPKLMVLNNQTAAMQVGDQVPIVTASSTSTITPDAPIVNAVEYRDTGVILKVTPRVNTSGLVLLDISQEVSDVSQTSTSNINSPTIQQRRISSSIAVQDGQTIALGGLIRDNDTRTKSGVPILSEIPILGGLFGRQSVIKRRTELLVLLTPRVVRNPDEALAVTEELRRKIREAKPLPPPRVLRR